MLKKIALWALGILVLALVGIGIVMGPSLKQFMHVDVVTMDANLKVFVGGGGNTVVLKSGDNRQVLVVDTKMGKGAQRIKAYVDSLSPDAKVTVINTHYHKDHTGGNTLFPQATLIAGDYPDDVWTRETQGRRPDIKIAAQAEQTLTFGDESVRVLNLGQAHTTQDMVVYLTHRKMLITGDVLFNHWHPVLKAESQAHVALWIKALDFLLTHFEIAQVVPGHGPLTDKNALVEIRDYFTDVYAAAGDPQKKATVSAKYKHYLSIPELSSMDKTIAYIEQEKQGQAK